MTSFLKRLFLPSGQRVEDAETQAGFEIRFENLPVGILRYNNGLWVFHYTDAFKEQKNVNPVSDFPNIEKTYTSEVLWPFFAVRIPGLKQPRVIEIMEEASIEPGNQIALLRKFGRYTVSNPYQLVPIE